MADSITDNRTLIDDAETVTPYDNLAGTADGTQDDEVYIEGSFSNGQYVADSLVGLLYDAGSAQASWDNSVFYIWINCGVVGLLDIKANGGFRIRFAGNTVTDWFEVYVAGSDEWPASIQGGWTQFVVDIVDARAAAVTNGWTNGTVPTSAQVRYVGWAGITAGTKPRMVDNTWMDEIRRLGDGNPGIIIQGQNGGTTDWDSDDIVTELGVSNGTFRLGPGGSYVANTPIQFGINDTETHGFTDTNKVWLWEDQEYIPSDLYGISALGNSGGTTNVDFGVKSGTGDAATGAQGLAISAASTGARWFADFDDPDLDDIGFYGCSFQHGADFQLDDPAVSVISSLLIDCTSATVSNAGDFLRNKIISANTADGVAFATTDDLTDIVFCEFEFSDGHAIELTTPNTSSQTSKGNLFANYGITTSNDAAIYNDSGSGLVTISVTDLGDTPTYRNGTSATTAVQNTVTLTTSCKDQVGDPIESVRVRIQETDGSLISEGSTNASGIYSDSTYNYAGDTDIEVVARKSSSADDPRYVNSVATGLITSAGTSVSITMVEDSIAA